MTKRTVLGIFDLRAFLNLAMLMVESERAPLLRQAILDIDTINQRTGGGTKYINQRDEDFVRAWFQEESYREQGVRRWIDWHAAVCRCYGETLRSLLIAGTSSMAQYHFGIFALAADGAISAG